MSDRGNGRALPYIAGFVVFASLAAYAWADTGLKVSGLWVIAAAFLCAFMIWAKRSVYTSAELEGEGFVIRQHAIGTVAGTLRGSVRDLVAERCEIEYIARSDVVRQSIILCYRGRPFIVLCSRKSEQDIERYLVSELPEDISVSSTERKHPVLLVSFP